MKANIDALLKARGQHRRELARWCRRGDSWIGKIMKVETREFPMKYFDRIADFFGISTYQLLLPGISPLTERRHVTRRKDRDRRISRALPLSEKPGDVDLMDVIRALSRQGREEAIRLIGHVLNDEIQRLRPKGSTDVPPDRSPKTSEGDELPKKKRPKKKKPPRADDA